MASWRCRGDGGPSCSRWSWQRRILGRGTGRSGAGRKRGLASGGHRAGTPGARPQVSAGTGASVGRGPEQGGWPPPGTGRSCGLAALCGGGRSRVFAQANLVERLCPPPLQPPGCLNSKGRRLRRVVENLALQVESCFVARFCLKSGEKWRFREWAQACGRQAQDPRQGLDLSSHSSSSAISSLQTCCCPAPNNFSPQSDKLLGLTAEQASCRPTKPAMVKVRKIQAWLVFKVGQRYSLYFRALSLFQRQTESPP